MSEHPDVMSAYDHPEAVCQRCGGNNVMSWHADSDRWNLAIEALGLSISAILCPGCFTEGHERATGLVTAWRLIPADPFQHGTWDDLLEEGEQ